MSGKQRTHCGTREQPLALCPALRTPLPPPLPFSRKSACLASRARRAGQPARAPAPAGGAAQPAGSGPRRPGGTPGCSRPAGTRSRPAHPPRSRCWRPPGRCSPAASGPAQQLTSLRAQADWRRITCWTGGGGKRMTRAEGVPGHAHLYEMGAGPGRALLGAACRAEHHLLGLHLGQAQQHAEHGREQGYA